MNNGSYLVTELTRDSLIIYKGMFSSLEPQVRHGNFTFFSGDGKIAATGMYVDDKPYGKWVYYDGSMDTAEVLDYTAVWNYLQTEARNYVIDTSFNASMKMRKRETMNPGGSFFKVDHMPQFRIDRKTEDFSQYILDHIHYPAFAALRGRTGVVVIRFLVDTEGKVRNPQFVESSWSDFNFEALRVLIGAPDWNPGIHVGKPVFVMFSQTFPFTREMNTGTGMAWAKPYDEDIVNPLFEGMDPAVSFRNFVAKELRYPTGAVFREKSGRILVSFIVTPEGKIFDIQIHEGSDPDLIAEAIRVVRYSEKGWSPANKEGRPVAVRYYFPFNFVYW